jgi:hypothetical protein
VKRCINNTERRRIEHRHVEIRLQSIPGHEHPQIDAKFALEDLELHPSAQIVLDAGFKDFAQQFPWGTVARPGAPWHAPGPRRTA